MKSLIIKTLVVVSLLLVCFLQAKRIEALKEECDTHEKNTQALMRDVKKFRVSDSLNAAKVGVLELEKQDFNKLRAEDAALVKKLQIKNRELVNMTSAEAETVVDLKGDVRDSTALIEGVEMDIQHFRYADVWIDVEGYILNSKAYDLKISIKEKLKLFEDIKYKKFLFFRTKKIKSIDYSIVSLNPYTTIENIEHIKIKR